MIGEQKEKRIGVISQEKAGTDWTGADLVLSAGGDLETYAAMLFSALRRFDDEGIELVYAQFCPEGDWALAIQNRLYRAAANKIVRV